jgi:hypothetical protein
MAGDPVTDMAEGEAGMWVSAIADTEARLLVHILPKVVSYQVYAQPEVDRPPGRG